MVVNYKLSFNNNFKVKGLIIYLNYFHNYLKVMLKYHLRQINH
jgi:hypothetical protein